METSQGQIAPGMEVFTSDGSDLGKIARIWWPDGRVEPADTAPPEGTFSIENVGRDATGRGYFQIDRVLSPDWYMYFDRIRDIFQDRVTLNLTQEEASRLPLQEKPD